MIPYIYHKRYSQVVWVCFHGFLGDYRDWNQVQGYLSCDDVVLWNLPGHGGMPLYDLEEEFQKFLSAFGPFDRVYLVGYSMGGRVAARLEKSFSACITRLFLISAHLGLKTRKEKKERELKEKLWVEKLRYSSFRDFLSDWYRQELFFPLQRRKKCFISMLERRLEGNPVLLAGALEQLSLAEQPVFVPICPTLAIYGQRDHQYAAYYAGQSCLRHRRVLGVGHCVHLESPWKLALLLQQESIGDDRNGTKGHCHTGNHRIE